MITKEDIINWSKPHAIDGKRTVIETANIRISIVGGRVGLYGDFENDFEVAIMDTISNEFVTRYLYTEANDDIIPYMKSDDMVNFVNSIIREDFHVR